jgi:acetyltransferase-like isoleucine patch superfamily enzyme
MSDVRIHPTAIIEEDVVLGRGTSVWDNVHIRHSTTLGEECIVGEKSYIAYGVRIGNRVKINAMVYICNAVTIEDGVMISAGTIFTNDRFPRATTPDLKTLRSSEPDEHTKPTLVREGATIGAGSTIGNDLVIGRFAMIGMGSLVTKSIPDFHLAMGTPARSVGAVCCCGQLLVRFAAVGPSEPDAVTCNNCDRWYSIGTDKSIAELTVD